MGRFDVIGDVHGQFDKLVELAKHLGYRETNGVWRHADRAAIFVGDLIDRGPMQLATVILVRQMVGSCNAQCIMGNHEFNAIAWATPDPQRPGKFLRDRDKPGNRQQHEVFLLEVGEESSLHAEVIGWFKTLPLWLDLGGLRVVHACWHQESMGRLGPLMDPGHTLTDELVLQGSQKGHWAYEAIEIVCKGPEIPLPHGSSFTDKEGKVRHNVRVRWWIPDAVTFREAGIVPPGNQRLIPDLPLPAEWKGHQYSGPPVLFGHYWFTGTPQVISPKFACLDYSVAKGGPLVAYRWDGERELSTEKLAWV
jgi:hypothetical protein